MVTIEEMTGLVPSLTNNPTHETVVLVKECIVDAQATLESDLGVPEGFFVPNCEASTKTFRMASPKLPLPPLQKLLSVSNGETLNNFTTSFSFSTFYNSDGTMLGYLELGDVSMSNYNLYPSYPDYACGSSVVTVNAIYGFKCIPESIRQAIKYRAAMLIYHSPRSYEDTDDAARRVDIWRESYNRTRVSWIKRLSYLNIGVV